ncbi:hypothetical protein Tco_1041874 [Tanacetum coccineum]|uniref:Uncharacterized protein n=1 Tax=Tanacetum coccineum TaxID=301880 RepID=A0ABQ5GIL5_9ASTR
MFVLLVQTCMHVEDCLSAGNFIFVVAYRLLHTLWCWFPGNHWGNGALTEGVMTAGTALFGMRIVGAVVGCVRVMRWDSVVDYLAQMGGQGSGDFLLRRRLVVVVVSRGASVSLVAVYTLVICFRRRFSCHRSGRISISSSLLDIHLVLIQRKGPSSSSSSSSFIITNLAFSCGLYTLSDITSLSMASSLDSWILDRLWDQERRRKGDEWSKFQGGGLIVGAALVIGGGVTEMTQAVARNSIFTWMRGFGPARNGAEHVIVWKNFWITSSSDVSLINIGLRCGSCCRYQGWKLIGLSARLQQARSSFPLFWLGLGVALTLGIPPIVACITFVMSQFAGWLPYLIFLAQSIDPGSSYLLFEEKKMNRPLVEGHLGLQISGIGLYIFSTSGHRVILRCSSPSGSCLCLRACFLAIPYAGASYHKIALHPPHLSISKYHKLLGEQESRLSCYMYLKSCGTDSHYREDVDPDLDLRLGRFSWDSAMLVFVLPPWAPAPGGGIPDATPLTNMRGYVLGLPYVMDDSILTYCQKAFRMSLILKDQKCYAVRARTRVKSSLVAQRRSGLVHVHHASLFVHCRVQVAGYLALGAQWMFASLAVFGGGGLNDHGCQWLLSCLRLRLSSVWAPGSEGRMRTLAAGLVSPDYTYHTRRSGGGVGGSAAMLCLMVLWMLYMLSLEQFWMMLSLRVRVRQYKRTDVGSVVTDGHSGVVWGVRDGWGEYICMVKSGTEDVINSVVRWAVGWKGLQGCFNGESVIITYVVVSPLSGGGRTGALWLPFTPHAAEVTASNIDHLSHGLTAEHHICMGADSSMHRSDPESEHSEQSSDDISKQDERNDSDMEDTDNAHIPKVSTTTWFKPIPESERPATPEPEWTIPPNDFPEPEHNWANAYASTFKVPEENKLQRKTYDIGSFIKWFCRRTGKKKLCKTDLEGPAFNLAKAFHKNSVFLQYQMDECHKLLTNKVDWSNPEGHQILRNIYEPLPLGGPPGQVTIQPQFFFNKDLDYLLTGDKERKIALSISKLKAARYLDFGLEELVPSLWVESEREYDISAVYGITHWWFRRKEFYINKHSESSDREAVRSHMRILSVVSVKVFEKYGYNYLREIILRRADYQEYKISEKDFKNLHPNDFEDLFLLNIQEKLNHLPKTDKTSLHTAVNMWIRNLVIRNRVGDLQLGIESYQTKVNLERPNWDAADYYFKEDYTIVPKPRAVVYRDRNNQRKLMRLNELHKFSDGTLTRVMEKLDQMVKDFHLFEYNKGMETRKWSEDDKRRSKDFITAIEKRLQIRRIYRSLESFVGGRIRDIDYRLINRTT